MGGGGGQILATWVGALVKCNVFRHFWVQKSLNKKRIVTSTRTWALEYFLFWSGVLRSGIWELGFKSVCNGLTKVTLKSSFFFLLTI